jgi:hypothetical protein
VKDGGVVAQEFQPSPGDSIHWTPQIEDSSAKYFFVRVWTAGGGDAPGADPAKPMAWLAPKPRRAAVFVPLGEADYYLTTCLNLSSNISRPFRYAS